MTKNNDSQDQGHADEGVAANFSRLRATTGDFSTLTDELKHLNKSPDEYWYAMGSRLLKILNERLYRAAGYASFSDYCARGLGYSRQHTYKLMKMVQYIDGRWAAARDESDRRLVERLFMLGFTKLYVIHSLPEEGLTRLLEQGVSWLDGDGERTVTLEAATIGQLKRALARGPARPRPARTRRAAPATTGALETANISSIVSMIKTQSSTLIQLIASCRNDPTSEPLKERLQLVEQYASAIGQGINAIEALLSPERDPY